MDNMFPREHDLQYCDCFIKCYTIFSILTFFTNPACWISVMTAVNILYLGDVVGRPARDFIVKSLASIKKIYNVDVVVANVENATSGAGITLSHAELLRRAGIDLMTLGDHAWDRYGFENDIDKIDYICRPANLPISSPGRDFIAVKKNGIKIGVAVVLGRHFMKINADSPFYATDRLIQQYRNDVDIMLLEMHAEATSEKIAFGWNYDGIVSAIVGSHTHVQTADDCILPKSTAYITDLGMCGAHESVLGREITPVLYSMKNSIPRKFEVATGDVRLHGVILSMDPSTGMAKKIVKFSERAQ